MYVFNYVLYVLRDENIELISSAYLSSTKVPWIFTQSADAAGPTKLWSPGQTCAPHTTGI